MLYEKYQRSMERISSILNGIKRFRFVIASVLAAIVILIGVGVAFTTGEISDNGYCPTEVVYGEEIGYEASARFATVSYEYCAVGSNDWSAKKPDRVGEYKIRAVAYGLTGNIQYGQTYEFKIIQREITITTASKAWVYDGRSHTATIPESVDNLIDGQVLVANEFTSITNVSDGEIDNVISYRIFGEDQQDFTENYNINVVAGKLKIEKREILVETASASWTHDGKEHYDVDNMVFALVRGHEVEVVNYTKITNVGQVQNVQKVIVKNSDGQDCSANYDIKYNYGTLTVR